MPALYDYEKALTLMRRDGLYAIAAPTGEKNEVFFIGQDGGLWVCRPTPSYPTTDFAIAAPYTLAQLETSGWILPNYHDVGDKAFRAFLVSLDVGIATVDGILCEIRRRVNGYNVSGLFTAAQETLDNTRAKIEECRRVEFGAKTLINTSSN